MKTPPFIKNTCIFSSVQVFLLILGREKQKNHKISSFAISKKENKEIASSFSLPALLNATGNQRS
ncbi:MAG TPA: hypothetical protein DHM44_03055 [Flexistipes sinusarabici]|uniref:Uncharacterized protein n=1 Tax=Flexistipes sinusarabici TaxID=2352 RepID=A0A3D5QAG0_FLESI|nr:hypothetical protein [Flexistipes sinusarabici]